MLEVQPDFSELCTCLNAHGAEYLIVGAYALAFHGAPRYTGDLDVWVRPTADNATRVIRALKDFGFSFPNLTTADFVHPDRVVQLGVQPVRIDLLTSLSGITWEEADAAKIPGSLGTVPVFFIGRTSYLANKRASGRKKDLADLEALGEA